MTFKVIKPLLAFLFLGFSPFLAAQWSLDNEASTLSFVTVKVEHVAEVHTFDRLSGSISTNGAVNIEIELASVNTLVPIRNERMQSMLFETNLFPTATIAGNVDITTFAGMSPGDYEKVALTFDLALRNQSKTYTTEVMVTRIDSGLMVSTIKPIVVTADSFDLLSGVEALREVAGLPSISRATPVSFQLILESD
ncbi:MAG TPA: YceI family protein [Gammaproteobacteria bacterium]|nr:YceI family protein [Gammaproteobacteria bacterium]|tara:strand:- start:376 stop:960 length:585 start_codon:yes stop_codon:yes gene_type:complete